MSGTFSKDLHYNSLLSQDQKIDIVIFNEEVSTGKVLIDGGKTLILVFWLLEITALISLGVLFFWKILAMHKYNVLGGGFYPRCLVASVRAYP